MKMKAIVLTGLLGWAGGFGTMLVAGSCDTVEEPEPTYPDHPDYPMAGEKRAMAPMDDGSGRCDMMAHPSVHLMVVKQFDDYFQAVDVDAVWYEWEGKTYEATCVPDGNDGCRAWLAGWEKEGEVTVSTEYCDVVVDEMVDVPITADGCHVDTQYSFLVVNTRGCMADTVPDKPKPKPLPYHG